MTLSAIRVEHLTKSFRIPHERRDTLREHLINLWHPMTYETFRAVDNISFEVEMGEFFGIIGPNGAGKSTLLKLIAGVLQPDSGNIKVQGRIAPFLELGVGFQPELSGKDNVFLYGALLGLTRKQIGERYDTIVAFAELERFMDQNVKNYSSGMQARLGFAITAHADADIFLVDEVLAVGDQQFQEKCFTTFKKLMATKKTIILVSHDLAAIKKFSNKTACIDDGKIIYTGTASDVISEYSKHL